MSTSNNLKSFTPVVGRAKSKRWVQASNPSYDGYDWTDGYEDDEYISEEEVPEIPQIEDIYPESISQEKLITSEQIPNPEISHLYSEVPRSDNLISQHVQSQHENIQGDYSFTNETERDLQYVIQNININHDDSNDFMPPKIDLQGTDLIEPLGTDMSQSDKPFKPEVIDETIRQGFGQKISPETTSSGAIAEVYEEFVDDYYNYDTDTEEQSGENGLRKDGLVKGSKNSLPNHGRNISSVELEEEIYKTLETEPIYSSLSPITKPENQATISDDETESGQANQIDNSIDIDGQSSLSTTRNSSVTGFYDDHDSEKDVYSEAQSSYDTSTDLYPFEKSESEILNKLPKVSISSNPHISESQPRSVCNNYGLGPYVALSASMDSVHSYSIASDSSASLSTGRCSTESSTFSHRGSFDQQSFTNSRIDPVLSTSTDTEASPITPTPKYYTGDGYRDLDDDEEQENKIAQTMASVKNAIPFDSITKINAPPRAGRWKPLPESVISNLKRDELAHNPSTSESVLNLTPIAENSERLSEEILDSIGGKGLVPDTDGWPEENEIQQSDKDIHIDKEDASSQKLLDTPEKIHEGVHDSGLNELYVNSRKFLDRPISQYDYQAAGFSQIRPLSPRKSNDFSDTILNKELKEHNTESPVTLVSDSCTITSLESNSRFGENNEENKNKPDDEHFESQFNYNVKPTFSVVSSIASTTSFAESMKPVDRQISTASIDENVTSKSASLVSSMLRPTLPPMFDFNGTLAKPKPVQKTLFDDARRRETEFVSGLDSWLAITYDGFINHKDSNGRVIRSVSTIGDIAVDKSVAVSSGSISSAGSMVSAGTTNLANGVRQGLSSLKHTKSVLNSDVVGKVGERSTHMIGLVGEKSTKRAKGLFAKSKKLIRSSGKE